MIPTYVIPYQNGDTKGELRIGWASWDSGNYRSRSIKWAYQDKSGKISRGSPEIPFDILLDMVVLAAAQGELDAVLNPPDLGANERKPVKEMTIDEIAKRRASR